MRTEDINRRLAAIGRAQHQVVRVEDATALGITRRALDRRVRTGLLERVAESTYRFTSSPSTWRQRALIAVWSEGPTAVLSHRAAAMLWRLDGVDQAPIEVLTPRWARRPGRRDVRLHETNQLLDVDRSIVEGIPCTSVVRTLLDCAGVLHPFRTDQLFEDALRKRLCTGPEVADRFVTFARPGRRGTRTMRGLLEKRIGRSVPTMSELERRFLDLVEAHDLRTPQLQWPVQLPDGTVYLDFAWPDILLAAECDGLFEHGTNLRLPWDDDRQNELQLRGWLVLRFTWTTLTTKPHVVVRQLDDAFCGRQLDSA